MLSTHGTKLANNWVIYGVIGRTFITSSIAFVYLSTWNYGASVRLDVTFSKINSYMMLTITG